MNDKKNREHPEVNDTKNICEVSPKTKSTKKVCNILEKEEEVKNKSTKNKPS